jgi:hypothetical protein
MPCIASIQPSRIRCHLRVIPSCCISFSAPCIKILLCHDRTSYIGKGQNRTEMAAWQKETPKAVIEASQITALFLQTHLDIICSNIVLLPKFKN